MWSWLKSLFGANTNQNETFLPPYSKQVIDVQAMSETIDWGIKSLGIPDIWKDTQGDDIKVAVLDTGIAQAHPDLKDTIVASKDFTGGDNPQDGNGHGSHCSGIVAARANNVGVVGVAPKAQIIAGKVLSDGGYGTIEWIVNGIYWAHEQGADIISMSLGSRYPDENLEKAIRHVIDNGRIVIAAAGNDGSGSNTINYPGAYEDVICVGSINSDKERSDFSSTGPNITIMAPGEDVLSCYPPDQYATFSGTSMATPFIAGVAALILSKHRKLGGKTPCENQKQMLEHLVRCADDMETEGRDNTTGWGLVNPRKSLDDEHNDG
ncbi:MAG: subtilisin Carlsberg [Deltaproteobacteria bacterium]|nr:MAG: subtilisin Carlsberg [Deltaproteobacteria bacterium]